VDAIFMHDLKNDLQLMKFLVRTIKDNSKIVDKLNTIIGDIASKCCEASGIPTETDVNKTIDKTVSTCPSILFQKVYPEKLVLKCNASRLQDALKNIVKNYKEAGSTILRIETRFNSIIIRGNSECSSETVDKLNAGIMFSTKGESRGIGSKSIAKFCEDSNIILQYYRCPTIETGKKTYTLGIKLKLPTK
jgi:hypothetical protein